MIIRKNIVSLLCYSQRMTQRKIIHIDMDAFYASVEQRDNPELRGKPLAVGHAEERGVVAAASYEARRYGVRSAMSSLKAKRLCPQLIFVSGRMDVYKSVSRQIHEIFHEYTDIIEPLSFTRALFQCPRKNQTLVFILTLINVGYAPDGMGAIRKALRVKLMLFRSSRRNIRSRPTSRKQKGSRPKLSSDTK